MTLDPSGSEMPGRINADQPPIEMGKISSKSVNGEVTLPSGEILSLEEKSLKEVIHNRKLSFTLQENGQTKRYSFYIGEQTPLYQRLIDLNDLDQNAPQYQEIARALLYKNIATMLAVKEVGFSSIHARFTENACTTVLVGNKDVKERRVSLPTKHAEKPEGSAYPGTQYTGGRKIRTVSLHLTYFGSQEKLQKILHKVHEDFWGLEHLFEEVGQETTPPSSTHQRRASESQLSQQQTGARSIRKTQSWPTNLSSGSNLDPETRSRTIARAESENGENETAFRNSSTSSRGDLPREIPIENDSETEEESDNHSERSGYVSSDSSAEYDEDEFDVEETSSMASTASTEQTRQPLREEYAASEVENHRSSLSSSYDEASGAEGTEENEEIPLSELSSEEGSPEEPREMLPTQRNNARNNFQAIINTRRELTTELIKTSLAQRGTIILIGTFFRMVEYRLTRQMSPSTFPENISLIPFRLNKLTLEQAASLAKTYIKRNKIIYTKQKDILVDVLSQAAQLNKQELQAAMESTTSERPRIGNVNEGKPQQETRLSASSTKTVTVALIVNAIFASTVFLAPLLQR